MARATVVGGACGFDTTIVTSMAGEVCEIRIHSDCGSVQRMDSELHAVDPMEEIGRGQDSRIAAACARHCSHSSCPVPAAIIRAVEVAAGLSTPGEIRITVSQD